MSSLYPSYVQEPNFILQIWTSNGKYLMSMGHVERKMAGGIQTTPPSCVMTAIASRCSLSRVSALHTHTHTHHTTCRLQDNTCRSNGLLQQLVARSLPHQFVKGYCYQPFIQSINQKNYSGRGDNRHCKRRTAIHR